MFIKRKILKVLTKYMDKPEPLVITGFRRVGKTFLIKHLYDELKTDNKIFLDLESIVNQRLFEKDNYEAIADSLMKLGLSLKASVPFIFLDEIQYVKKIPSVVKYLYDHYGIKFVLTGSSSFYLKNQFSESLSGRKFLFELYPLDFEEFLWFKGEKISINSNYEQLRHLYDQFLEYGGLPGVVLENDVNDKILRLDDALGSYFQLDVKNLANFRDLKDLESLLFLLSSRVGSKLDVGKLAQSLSVSRQTLYNYLEFLRDTYLIDLVPAYSKAADIQVRKVPKIYFKDSGLLNRVGKVSQGSLFENTVFNQIVSMGGFTSQKRVFNNGINFFQKKSGAEIDFVVNNTSYEIKLTATQNDVNRLQKFSSGLNLDNYFVVSLEKVNVETPHIIYPFTLVNS